MPKGWTPALGCLRLRDHGITSPPPGEAGTTFTHQLICNSLTPPASYICPQNEGPEALPLLPCFALCPLPFAYALFPNLGKACLFPENILLINFVCILIDLLVCNSPLHWQEESSFPHNINLRNVIQALNFNEEIETQKSKSLDHHID